MHATEVFGNYAQDYPQTVLSDEVLHHAKRAVIDWHASLFPGLAAPPLAQLEDVLAEDLDRGRAHLGNGRRATARAAALVGRFFAGAEAPSWTGSSIWLQDGSSDLEANETAPTGSAGCICVRP